MRLLTLAVALGCALTAVGCGGGDRQRAADYQSAVRAISDGESAALARTAAEASFATPASAAASTTAYAQTFADAAAKLARLGPPDAAQAEHEALMRVYRELAGQCTALARQLAIAPDAVAVDQLTRQLAALVEQAGTRERAAREELERALAPLLRVASQGGREVTIVGSNEA